MYVIKWRQYRVRLSGSFFTNLAWNSIKTRETLDWGNFGPNYEHCVQYNNSMLKGKEELLRQGNVIPKSDCKKWSNYHHFCDFSKALYNKIGWIFMNIILCILVFIKLLCYTAKTTKHEVWSLIARKVIQRTKGGLKIKLVLIYFQRPL